jgi:hypothetical protein
MDEVFYFMVRGCVIVRAWASICYVIGFKIIEDLEFLNRNTKLIHDLNF